MKNILNTLLKSNLASKILYIVINSKSYTDLCYNNHLSFLKPKFKHFGKNSTLPLDIKLKNPQYISIGDNFMVSYNFRIEAWDEYMGNYFSPEIFIGDNVIMNNDIHIGAINKIYIGNNVLLASRIFISDHYHGNITSDDLALPPAQRMLFSKGPVCIQDNVWIGEGVSILPGVTIGKNSIIGANSVVTKDIPSNVVAAGIPAVILKTL